MITVLVAISPLCLLQISLYCGCMSHCCNILKSYVVFIFTMFFSYLFALCKDEKHFCFCSSFIEKMLVAFTNAKGIYTFFSIKNNSAYAIFNNNNDNRLYL